jgi:hypothetical protein
LETPETEKNRSEKAGPAPGAPAGRFSSGVKEGGPSQTAGAGEIFGFSAAEGRPVSSAAARKGRRRKKPAPLLEFGALDSDRYEPGRLGGPQGKLAENQPGEDKKKLRMLTGANF